MDKLSVKVLRYLKKQSEPVDRDVLIAKFGNPVIESIRFLENAAYIKSGSKFFPHTNSDGKHSLYVTNHKYKITSLGLDFLQAKPGKDFDRWLNRVSIILSILGGALLSKPLWTLIEWFWELIMQGS